MRQWALRSANVVLFVLGCFLAAQIVVSVLAEIAVPDEAAVSMITPVAHSPSRSSEDAERKSILDRNLFGARLAGETQQTKPPEEDTQVEAVATKLPLDLLGTVAADNQAFSNAAIMDRGTRKHQVVFIGDTLDAHPRVEVIAISRRTVYLQNGAKRERLDLLEEDGEADGNKPRRARGRVQARAPRQRKRSTIADRIEKLQSEGGRTTASLYSQARIVPEWSEGEMVGVRLNQVKPGSLYEKLGIESGDVITTLNGISIDSPQASSRLLTELTQAEEFKIELQDGEVIDVPPDELENLLGDQ